MRKIVRVDRTVRVLDGAEVRQPLRGPKAHSVGAIEDSIAPTGGRRERGRRWAHRLRSDDSGANPIELAILFPIVVIALFASIQVSLYFLAKSEALAAAQAGVTAQRGYMAPPGIAAQRATAYINGSHGWLVAVKPTVVNPAPIPPTATHITVTVSGDALSLIPGWNGWRVSETAGGQLERISQPGGP